MQEFSLGTKNADEALDLPGPEMSRTLKLLRFYSRTCGMLLKIKWFKRPRETCLTTGAFLDGAFSFPKCSAISGTLNLGLKGILLRISLAPEAQPP